MDITGFNTADLKKILESAVYYNYSGFNLDMLNYDRESIISYLNELDEDELEKIIIATFEE